ncbi:hypothetical protein LUZ63_020069 [Rhynchospora breviuscula]|uniref:AAA+ ATPase domain-containing protein n=1 Tax=Rhynchospora breviuscula TaxID=2022672 RepID=A0A9Q0C129_9POAL|nr:hypothetical protein LUZ63_020069 [Rhynchospora breviuscula]
MVLHAAAAADLPSPRIVSPTPWDTTLQFDPENGWDDFTAWTTWLETTPAFVGWHDQAVQRWEATATLFEVSLRLVARKRVALVCPDCKHVAARHGVIGCSDCRACFHTEHLVNVLAEQALAREARQAGDRLMGSFAPATRAATKARIALSGPSGSGKTYTALALAHGLGKRIAVIDSERGSASKYAGVNGWSFDTVAPASFAPASLIQLLAEAGAEGYDVVVIDSMSHYWMGVDGMLEQVDKHARGGGNFTGWKEERPVERRMIDALIAYPGHVIATMRVKTEYVIEENERGKKVPRKVGLKPEQREGIEYEFDLVGDLDHANTLTVSKSRIPGLTRSVVTEPGADLAATVADWLSEGESVEDASDIRAQVLADDVALDHLVELGARVNMLGIARAAVTNADGQTVALVDLIRDRWRELNAATESTALTEALADVLAAERADHLVDLVDRYDDEGTRSFDVRLPADEAGERVKVATITLSVPKDRLDVTSEDDLLDWAEAAAPWLLKETRIPAVPQQVIPAQPERVETTLDRAQLEVFLKAVKPGPNGSVVDPDTGQLVDGMTHTPGGAPRSFSVRYADDGREDLIRAWRRGDLEDVLSGTPLPQIGGGQ